MGDTQLQRVIRERQRDLRRTLGTELRRVRLDAGLSLRSLGEAVGVDASHLARVEAGERDLGMASLVAVGVGLGTDVSIRLYPTDGPRVHDHIQVRMIEALLRVLHPRWRARLEVGVYRPVRGVIDVALHDPAANQVVATESHSGLHTVEQQLRWAGQKADALPSARGWPWGDAQEPPAISRLLLLRTTEANRALVRDLAATFRTAYPGSTPDAYAALTSADRTWPGAAVVWVDVRGAGTRVLQGPPRGL
jgi:transcriptional regulator with XRE-family HTH domain